MGFGLSRRAFLTGLGATAAVPLVPALPVTTPPPLDDRAAFLKSFGAQVVQAYDECSLGLTRYEAKMVTYMSRYGAARKRLEDTVELFLSEPQPLSSTETLQS